MFDKNPHFFTRGMLPAHVRTDVNINHNQGQYSRIQRFMKTRAITPSNRQHLAAVLHAIKRINGNAYADGLVYPVQPEFVSWEIKHYGGPKLQPSTKPVKPAWEQKLEKYM